MKIIFNNALPRSGKDTFTNRLVSTNEDFVHVRFKDPLYRELSKRHGIPMETVYEICEGDQKDLPCDIIGGLIPRQELIDISENKIKVERGPTGVAQLVVDDILDTPDFVYKTFVFSDGGFEEEISFLERVLKRYGLEELLIVRIERDYEHPVDVKDSRKIVENPDLIITNNILEEGDELGANMVAQFNAFLAAR